MIDLHLHTTASDGFDTPEQLVPLIARAGIRIFAVTDHDTVAGLPVIAAAAAACGLAFIPGIEITAVEDGRDIHVLGYGFDSASTQLAAFLAGQRASRLDRIRTFGARFQAMGMPFDVASLVAQAEKGGGRSVGRAHVARALVAAGHVISIEQAFSQWLSPDRPGFVAPQGAPVGDVVTIIKDAGGISSLAHPGLIGDDGLVGRLLADDLDALEAYHSEHDAATTERYCAWAEREGLAVSGGSDFHGEAANRRRVLGQVSLPVKTYEQLRRSALAGGCAYVWPEASN